MSHLPKEDDLKWFLLLKTGLQRETPKSSGEQAEAFQKCGSGLKRKDGYD